ncbi:hypothetical protein O159_06600 [Leifsonia xyli subsp. cynodontis DSM 46306]|uniref:Cardiolipin synthase N-terminal domain-containing protein n=1 Tax=Leifsonia xyli subsp. cynodontis DSM 46306 TaxID=1389489 RepID=U3P5V4_LEIXC|nr:hypothetical protein O159_06600 [Leifsonia xyli subsp. cynodontis DSM 46306]
MAVIPLLVFALFLVALIDIILRTGDQIRHLPKLAWIVVVLLLPLIGSVLWFGLGRERSGMRAPRPVRPQRTVIVRESAPMPGAPTTEEQLEALEREIAADRIRQLEAELRQRRGRSPRVMPGVIPAGRRRERRGADCGVRTRDRSLTRRVLYQLS